MEATMKTTMLIIIQVLFLSSLTTAVYRCAVNNHCPSANACCVNAIPPQYDSYGRHLYGTGIYGYCMLYQRLNDPCVTYDPLSRLDCGCAPDLFCDSSATRHRPAFVNGYRFGYFGRCSPPAGLNPISRSTTPSLVQLFRQSHVPIQISTHAPVHLTGTVPPQTTTPVLQRSTTSAPIPITTGAPVRLTANVPPLSTSSLPPRSRTTRSPVKLTARVPDQTTAVNVLNQSSTTNIPVRSTTTSMPVTSTKTPSYPVPTKVQVPSVPKRTD